MKQIFAALALAALGGPAWAAGDVYIPLPTLEVDESQIQVAAVMPFGQTFTPTEPTVGTIWLRVTNMNVGYLYEQDKWITLDLHAGDDFSGPVLASATTHVEALLGTQQGSVALVGFGFADAAVTSGQTYSFEVKVASARYGVNWQHNDWYGGGHAIALGGAIPGSDLYFSIAAVPEPAAWQFLLLGAALFVGLRRRHSKRQA